ncbi:hypothetical protein Pmani_035040 [Petrolisthes manimaculis]|uniref:rRNA methyltransferase 1, mitochondrial n=1 Tax=Petrolisthes manimaculis TaxID=1843537 RepID=A0AAE1TQX7_9EUCA|nr:hypothetical protein Pmani_035040 [Petrolisthes manimaculis]
MLGSIFNRSASNKAFSIPPVKFRFATRDFPAAAKVQSRPGEKEKHIPRITNPVRPTHKVERKNHSERNVTKERLLNQVRKKQTSRKNELGLENCKVHEASFSNRFDPKRDKRQHDTYQPSGELIYGIYPVQLALETQRRTFHHLMYKQGCEVRSEKIKDILHTAASRGIRTTGLTSSQFRKMLTGDQTHQGVCCDVSHLPFLVFQKHEYFPMKEYGEVVEIGEESVGTGIWEGTEVREGKEVRDDRGLKENGKRRKNDRTEKDKYSSSESGLDEKYRLHINNQDHLSGRANDKRRHKNVNISVTPVNHEHYRDKYEHENLKIFTASTVHNNSNYYQKELGENRTDIIINHNDPLHHSSESKIPQLWIYLDQIQDPMNFGAVLRSAYFFGVDKILTSEHNSCTLSGVVSKASSGVSEVVPVYTLPHPSAVILSQLSKAGWVLAASAHPDAGSNVTPVDTFTPHGNTILIIGNESKGVQEEVLSVCHVVLTVPPVRPLHQAASCLNVSAATAVLLHSLRSKLHKFTCTTPNSIIPSFSGS